MHRVFLFVFRPSVLVSRALRFRCPSAPFSSAVRSVEVFLKYNAKVQKKSEICK
jgi:hypothetical protein